MPRALGYRLLSSSHLTLADQIREKLATLEPESIDVDDESALHAGHEGAKGGGGHYRLSIVSQRFSGLALPARHRMIYQALAPLMNTQIHALAIHAYAPDEI